MPIDSNLMLSADDTSMHVFEGINRKKYKWRLVNIKVFKNAYQFSMHEINENAENSKEWGLKWLLHMLQIEYNCKWPRRD